ncbi:14709_t:CDS:1, partial [Gigaspora rosea]
HTPWGTLRNRIDSYITYSTVCRLDKRQITQPAAYSSIALPQRSIHLIVQRSMMQRRCSTRLATESLRIIATCSPLENHK